MLGQRVARPCEVRELRILAEVPRSWPQQMRMHRATPKRVAADGWPQFFRTVALMQPNVVSEHVIIACVKAGRAACRRVIPRFSKLAVSLGITGLFAIGYPAEVRAQTIFCPATFGSGIHPLFCQTGRAPMAYDGAFSGAALASQALSELSQTTTQVTTKEIGKAIVERREQERERCRDFRGGRSL